jgi:predicted methyltransferase
MLLYLVLRSTILKHERKRELYEEIYDIVNPTGVFCNLEHVAWPSVELDTVQKKKIELIDCYQSNYNWVG